MLWSDAYSQRMIWHRHRNRSHRITIDFNSEATDCAKDCPACRWVERLEWTSDLRADVLARRFLTTPREEESGLGVTGGKTCIEFSRPQERDQCCGSFAEQMTLTASHSRTAIARIGEPSAPAILRGRAMKRKCRPTSWSRLVRPSMIGMCCDSKILCTGQATFWFWGSVHRCATPRLKFSTPGVLLAMHLIPCSTSHFAVSSVRYDWEYSSPSFGGE